MTDNDTAQGKRTGSPLTFDAVTTFGPSSNYEILGQLAATDATGVKGRVTASSSVTYGVLGASDSYEGKGVVGSAASGSIPDGRSGLPTGVWGYTDRSGTDSNVDESCGVFGQAETASGLAYGVYGTTASSEGYGVYSDGDSKTTGDHEVSGSQSVGSLGASVYLSSTQSIVDDTLTTVEFDGVVADDRREWNQNGNYTFTCASDGDYHVSTTVDWRANVPAGTKHVVDIQVGGSSRATRNRSVVGDSGVLTEHVCKTLRGLSSGDTISIRVKQTSGSTLDLGTGRAQTYATFDKVG